jgi:protein-S-isoprenylcysteine O-methyltransferase Ste14
MMSLVVSWVYRPAFRIEMVPRGVLIGLGLCLVVMGLLFFLASVRAVHRAYNAGRLVTEGVYSCCRHPLYASWVVFIVPGIVLLSGSWLAITTPVFMYFLLRILVTREEACLEEVFGSAYLAYKKKVPCVFPLGRIPPEHKYL